MCSLGLLVQLESDRSCPQVAPKGHSSICAHSRPRGGVVQIEDATEVDLINLRRTIYLTIMSSLDFEECAHKLLKIDIPEGNEKELCAMLIECCSQERT